MKQLCDQSNVVSVFVVSLACVWLRDGTTLIQHQPPPKQLRDQPLLSPERRLAMEETAASRDKGSRIISPDLVTGLGIHCSVDQVSSNQSPRFVELPHGLRPSAPSPNNPHGNDLIVLCDFRNKKRQCMEALQTSSAMSAASLSRGASAGGLTRSGNLATKTANQQREKRSGFSRSLSPPRARLKKPTVRWLHVLWWGARRGVHWPAKRELPSLQA